LALSLSSRQIAKPLKLFSQAIWHNSRQIALPQEPNRRNHDPGTEAVFFLSIYQRFGLAPPNCIAIGAYVI
jgi:hypothetical protein